jgi:hypothetical protein
MPIHKWSRRQYPCEYMPRNGCRITKFNLHLAKSPSARLFQNPVENRQRYATIMSHFLRAVHLKSRLAARIAERHLGWGTSSVLLSVNYSRQDIINKIILTTEKLSNTTFSNIATDLTTLPNLINVYPDGKQRYGLQNKRRTAQNIHGKDCKPPLCANLLAVPFTQTYKNAPSRN